MGGGGGGSFSNEDLQALEAKAKSALKRSVEVSRHVFISFAHEDLDVVNLLRGQAKNANLDLQFDDHSVKIPFDSTNANYIRGRIRENIERCSVTLVYLTDRSSESRWVNWEIQESMRQGKGVIGVYQGNPPLSLPSAFIANKCTAVRWGHEELSAAIEKASVKRSGP